MNVGMNAFSLSQTMTHPKGQKSEVSFWFKHHNIFDRNILTSMTVFTLADIKDNGSTSIRCCQP